VIKKLYNQDKLLRGKKKASQRKKTMEQFKEAREKNLHKAHDTDHAETSRIVKNLEEVVYDHQRFIKESQAAQAKFAAKRKETLERIRKVDETVQSLKLMDNMVEERKVEEVEEGRWEELTTEATRKRLANEKKCYLESIMDMIYKMQHKQPSPGIISHFCFMLT
jgi:hypothetical protein